jgi:hypothetical protein
MSVIRREDLVGTVCHGSLIIKFLGEGASGVVYGVASPEDPAPVDTGTTLKMSKNQPCFEMSVLHYEYKIHEAFYQNHPLAMSAEQRMALLREEMLQRIRGNTTALRAFRDVYDDWFPNMGRMFGESFQKGTLRGDFLKEYPQLAFCIDRVLVDRLESAIEEDHIVDTWVPFARFALGIARTIVNNHTSDELSGVLATNALANLLGVYSLDFINRSELADIAASSELDELVGPHTLDGFFYLTQALYHSAEIRRQSVLKESRADWTLFQSMPEDGTIPSAHLETMIDKMQRFVAYKSMTRAMEIARASGYLLSAFAPTDDARSSGRGKYMLAQCALWLRNGLSSAEPLLESALADFEGPENRRDRVNTLILLANVVMPADPARASRYRAEAERLAAL